MNLTLPTDSTRRKEFPVFSGVLAYFPAAIARIANWSKRGNDKHNPGEPLHHARGKSMDHRDCIPRHLMDLADLEAVLTRETQLYGTADGRSSADKLRAELLDEATALAWRANALLQELCEKYDSAPLAPGARLPIVAALIACKGANCGSTDPRLHSQACMDEHDRTTRWTPVRRKPKAKRPRAPKVRRNVRGG